MRIFLSLNFRSTVSTVSKQLTFFKKFDLNIKIRVKLTESTNTELGIGMKQEEKQSGVKEFEEGRKRILKEEEEGRVGRRGLKTEREITCR